MTSELNMYESQVVEHKMDIDKLQRELQEVKKKYYLQKKKEHNQKWGKVGNTITFPPTHTFSLFQGAREGIAT